MAELPEHNSDSISDSCELNSAHDDVPSDRGPVRYGVTARVAVSLNKDVAARRLAYQSEGDDCMSIAASLSDNSIQLYKGNELNKITTLKGHTAHISGVKFSESNPSVLYSSSEDGSFRIWDLRQGVTVKSFIDDTDGGVKPFCSFDVNCQETFVCCGTELIKTQAYVLFWDLRLSKLCGGYWDSHNDDITHLQFKRDDPNILASGSTDGLINIFDISNSVENDALQMTMNTESSVDTLSWYSSLYCPGMKNIACLTHDEKFQLWNVEDATCFRTYSRDDIACLFKCQELCASFVSLATGPDGALGVIASSKRGCAYLLNVENDKLLNHGVLDSVHSEPLCSAYWNLKNGLVITSDDSGMLCLWQEGAEDVYISRDKSDKDKFVGKQKEKWLPTSTNHPY